MAACAHCGVAIPAGSELTFRGGGRNAPAVIMCSTCARTVERTLEAETEDIKSVNALLLGLGAALLASTAWYGVVVITNFQLGIIAVGVGWLVAQAVMLGAGRKRGASLQGLSVAITVLAMAFSQYLIVRHFAVQQLSKQGYKNIPLLLPLDLMVKLIVESLKADPLTLLFWAIAVWEAYKLPAARRLQKVTPSTG